MTDIINAIKALVEWGLVGGAITVCIVGYKQAEKGSKHGY